MNIKKVLGYTVPPVITLLAGMFIGHQRAKSQLAEEFEAELAQEIDELRSAYARKYKREEYETPEKARETLSTQRPPQGFTPRKTFIGPRSGQEIPESPYHRPPDVSDADLQNIATSLAKEEGYIQGHNGEEDWLMESQNFDENLPHIITVDEFLSNTDDNNYDRPTYAYYSDDDVLLDESGQIIEDIDDIVGRENLQRFGEGSKNPNLIYIRNRNIEKDIEITRIPDSYQNLMREASQKDGFEGRHNNGRRINHEVG